jgi:SAM-dependent methyltransferase
METAFDSTERFSNRVADYIRFRPSYPPQILQTLRDECGLQEGHVIADIGSGTGIWSEILLRNGNTVFGVEPNRAMREAAEKLLIEYSMFHSVAAPAEATTLPAHSVHFVTAAQAFHWFDRERCKVEFQRILRPQGFVVLLWNERQTDTTPFLRDYENLLQTFATDYAQVNHTNIDDAALRDFYGGDFTHRTFANAQTFDYAGVAGRLLSSSYAPDASDARHAPMLRELKNIFARHQNEGVVRFEYSCNLYFGQMNRVLDE